MIILIFFILTSSYNPEVLPSLTGTPTGAATAGIGLGPAAVWSIIMLLLVMGIIAGIILWWRNHQKIQIQKALQQEVRGIVTAAETKREPKSKVTMDSLTRKLNKVQQELMDIPLRSAATGHIIHSISSGDQEVPSPSPSLRHLLPRRKPQKKVLPLHKVQHRPSLNEKMMKIKKEIGRIKTE